MISGTRCSERRRRLSLTLRSDRNRHLDRDRLREYLEAGVPAAVPIDGTPPMKVIVEPAASRIAVRAPWNPPGVLPDLTSYRFLDTVIGSDESGDWVEFGVVASGGLLEAYSALTAVADRIQLDGDDVGTAIDCILDRFHAMLSAIGRLSEKQEIGLFGELLVLRHLVRRVGGELAVEAWTGPSGEEHDFALDGYDIEVKTTVAEGRTHSISSVTQLQATSGRNLWLLSVPLTAGGSAGRSLPELVEAIHGELLSPTAVNAFRSALDAAGWEPGCENLYRRRFILRGPCGSMAGRARVSCNHSAYTD